MENTRKTKVDQVYHHIRERINSNEYLPGMHITESAICKELNVSRTPAREAIRRLVAENYLVQTPGLGLVVTNVDLTDLIEVYEIREVLEGVATRLFFDRHSLAALNELNNLIEKQTEAFQNNDSAGFMKYDMEFHYTIFKECGNKRLYSSLMNIYDLINRIAFINKDDARLDKLALYKHRDIYASILNGHKADAIEAMQEHIRQIKAYYLKQYYNL